MVAFPTISMTSRYSGHLPFRVYLGPWLNPIEPMLIHGKRKLVAPDGVLVEWEFAERACEVFGCAHEPHLSIYHEVPLLCTRRGDQNSIYSSSVAHRAIAAVLLPPPDKVRTPPAFYLQIGAK